MKKEYLVIGAGLFGSVFAFEAARRGHHVVVLEKRDHIGGNIYTEEIEGIQVHKYGAHIFHTSMKNIWEYINRFATFNNYVNSPIANYHNEIYNLPFNMNTFNKLWGVITPDEAKRKIDQQKKNIVLNGKPQNLEEQALSLVGPDVYIKLVKGYTEKQWGISAKELPAFIIRRLPVRFTYDNNYFNDPYQGIPIGGYTQIIEKMLASDLIDVHTGTDYFNSINEYSGGYEKIIFTGMIDQFYNYELGTLEYRSLKFKTQLKETSNFQGNAVVNYTDEETPFTRIIEHKHFEFGNGNKDKTVITYEYPTTWSKGAEPYYPINNKRNKELYTKYSEMAKSKNPEIIFGGRLGQYRYYNMDQTIMAALQAVKQEFGE
ncbi:UDP-galactopyranose mutase [Levilactobacillus zymae]|uniref:UDP-galactopyranose mutase n=1 Tax=Levilactobacillus zymae TaxID=267363 RepID=A0ABQ0WX82_9LACO|nr:UDP-galactopyranose mutase [Levilactobacillus zymae]KRL13147.1 UDP-galactopyranose mutase [Levilactobacillus zymae DSM 19395]QFR61160.1 UDP-galactopyranose mutase [Levilactobacillus zymae]GEO72155.1 UDP-galactopyranose mutase [Levilactobacillus zymae]